MFDVWLSLICEKCQFTANQTQVFMLSMRGLSVCEICERLGVSNRACYWIIQKITDKLSAGI